MLKPLILLGLALLVGCESQTKTPIDRDRILHMAGEEAGQIAAPRERLTRQLNIAFRETERGRPDNARKTLAVARQTLEQSGKDAFTDQQRLAGWISLCELARDANDQPFANSALEQAQSALNQLTPEPSRCDYVLGIEREVRAMRGEPAAAAFLRKAADWAMDLNEQTRRNAFYAFAFELISCNDYDGASETLRHDKDAAWRSDALTAMADGGSEGQNALGNIAAQATAGGLVVSKSTGKDAGPTSMNTFNGNFGKSLDFRSNYYRQ